MLIVDKDVTELEARHVANHLRKEDMNELLMVTNSPHMECLDSVNGSKYTFCIKNEEKTPIAILGLAELPENKNIGIVWLLCTPDTQKNPVEFYKIIKDLLAQYGSGYDLLENFVPAKSYRNQAFIDSLGFVFDECVYTNAETGDEYLRFTLETTKGLFKMYYEESKEND